MMNHARIPAPPRRRRSATLARVLSSGRGNWGLRRIRRAWFSPPPLPSIEEVEARLRSYPGFFASLTPEQRAIMDAWNGPEVLGDPNGPKRKY